jgi:hypothetical protein
MRLAAITLLTLGLCFSTSGAAEAKKYPLSKTKAMSIVRDEQMKELSGRYVEHYTGPITFRNTYCARRSGRKFHCYYATFFNAPNPDETDETVDGYACGRSVDVRLAIGAAKPRRKVRWAGCEVLRYGS